MRILLVDDDQLIRFVHQMFIERAGHEVVGVAEEEAQAVQLALELKPDVIVMDIRLENGSNGIHAMKTIQETLDIPAIYISGNSDNKTLEEAEQTTMKAFLVKPVTQDEIAKALRDRLSNGLKRISFYIIPSAAAFLVLGDVVVGTIFQTGKFLADDTLFVWLILAGSTVGLVATTQSRLCISVFWALRDTRTPSKFAFLRVILTGFFGYLVTFPLRTRFDWPVLYSAAGLTASAGVAGWLEFLLIRNSLTRKIGYFSLGGSAIPKAWSAALVASAVGYAVKLSLPLSHPFITGVIVLGIYAVSYLALAWVFGLEEVSIVIRPVLRILNRRK